MTSTGPRSIALFTLAALLAAPAHSDTAAEDPGWEFQVAPYLWLFSLKGDMGAGGQESSVSTNLIDLFENTDSVVGVLANLQARNGGWTILADPIWMRVTDDIHAGGNLGGSVSADLTLNALILDLMVMREVWRHPLGEPVVEKGMPQRGVALDLLAGTRIWVLKTELDLKVATPGPILDNFDREFNDTQSWADPLLGARGTLDLTDRLHFVLRADIGGFQVSSELTSEQWANLVYDFELFGLDAAAGIGYRGLYTDYYKGNGGFEMKTWIYGPTIGVGLEF